MRQFLMAGIMMAALALSAVAQDWYHERDERFRGEQWKIPHLHAREVRSGTRLERQGRRQRAQTATDQYHPPQSAKPMPEDSN